MAEVRAVGGAGDLDDLGVGHELGQCVDGAAVVPTRTARRARAPGGRADASMSNGGAGAAQVGELGHQGGAVGLPSRRVAGR